MIHVVLNAGVDANKARGLFWNGDQVQTSYNTFNRLRKTPGEGPGGPYQLAQQMCPPGAHPNRRTTNREGGLVVAGFFKAIADRRLVPRSARRRWLQP